MEKKANFSIVFKETPKEAGGEWKQSDKKQTKEKSKQEDVHNSAPYSFYSSSESISYNSNR